MKIYTRLEFQMTSDGLELLQSESFDYRGPVAECKGGDVAKTQMNEQNALQRDAYNLMKQRQNEVEGSVGKYLTGDVGFNPEQLALMRSQLLNQLSSNYNQGGKNVMTALARRGSVQSGAPVGGDFTRGIAALEGGMASDRSSGLANIDLNNLQQALTNKFNAASLINGQAAQLASPISTFGAGSSNALNQYMTAANSGFGASFMRSLGSGLGGGAASFITGGFGSLGSMVPHGAPKTGGG
jgi:hypothetical protein